MKNAIANEAYRILKGVTSYTTLGGGLNLTVIIKKIPIN